MQNFQRNSRQLGKSAFRENFKATLAGTEITKFAGQSTRLKTYEEPIHTLAYCGDISQTNLLAPYVTGTKFQTTFVWSLANVEDLDIDSYDCFVTTAADYLKDRNIIDQLLIGKFKRLSVFVLQSRPINFDELELPPSNRFFLFDAREATAKELENQVLDLRLQELKTHESEMQSEQSLTSAKRQRHTLPKNRYEELKPYTLPSLWCADAENTHPDGFPELETICIISSRPTIKQLAAEIAKRSKHRVFYFESFELYKNMAAKTDKAIIHFPIESFLPAKLIPATVLAYAVKNTSVLLSNALSSKDEEAIKQKMFEHTLVLAGPEDWETCLGKALLH